MYEIKYPLLGFEHLERVYIEKHDGLTSMLKSKEDENFHLTLVHSASDKKYFEVPIGIKTLLDIEENTNYSVYFTTVIDKNTHESTINLGAPILFNEVNKTVAQCIINTDSITLRELDLMDLPTLSMSSNQNLKISNLLKNLD